MIILSWHGARGEEKGENTEKRVGHVHFFRRSNKFSEARKETFFFSIGL